MGVSKGGVLTVPFNWSGILRNSNQYTFHPRFLHDESAAFKVHSQEVAEGFVRVLASSGIDAEIVVK
jgi:hypothetical protein